MRDSSLYISEKTWRQILFLVKAKFLFGFPYLLLFSKHMKTSRIERTIFMLKKLRLQIRVPVEKLLFFIN